MSSQPTLWDTLNATSSPEEVSGATPSDSPDGLTSGPSGPPPLPAPVSARQAKVSGLATLATSGQKWRDSSASETLQSSLESRLLLRLDTAGSTLFKLTWKRCITPLGRRYLQQQARARPTSVSVSISSVPTPQAHDVTTRGNTEADCHYYPHDLSNAATLASVPTLMAGSPATETYNAAGNTDYSRRIVDLATLSGVPTPCTPNGGRSCSTEVMDATGRMQDGTKHTASLEHAVKLSAVATPRSEDSQCAGAHRGTPDTLHSQANLYAVAKPAKRDYKSDSATEEFHQAQWNHPRGKPLIAQVSLSAIPTPVVRDHRNSAGDGMNPRDLPRTVSGVCDPGADPDGSTRSRLDQLPRQVQLAGSGQTATGGTAETASAGQLDPAYSRWLQGVHPTWCWFAAKAKRSIDSARRRRGSEG